MKSETMTIGVPVELYTRLSRKQIKERLIEKMNTVSEFYYYAGKKVNMGIRLEPELADRIRTNAALNEVAITVYTASILNNGGKAWLENL